MHRFLLSLMLLLLATPVFAAGAPSHEPRANITVLADEMLMQPMSQIVRSYAVTAGTPVTVVVKSAADIESQIGAGLEAHVVITANKMLLNRLSERGLVDVSSRRTVARTSLALVTTNERQATLGIAKRISFASILNSTKKTPILTSDADTFEGALALALTHGQSFSNALDDRLETRANADEVLASLRDENALGLILATQAVGEPDIAILSLLPDTISPPVNFEAVIIGGELMDEASAFVNYLQGGNAEKIFSRFGYQTH